MNNKIQAIGILRALYLGDMLCIIPLVRAVRKAYPEAHITLIGLCWQKDFVERFRHYFDDFLEFSGWPGLAEQKVNPQACLTFLQQMQRLHFDLVLQVQGNGEITNSLCMLFNAGKVCGLRKKNEYAPDENLFPVSEDDEHEILRFLKLADALNIPRQGEELEFRFFQNEIHNATAMLENMNLVSGNFFCVHPGARDPKRRWPLENFAWTADRLIEKGYDILVTGSQDEADLLQAVKQSMTHPAVDLVSEFGQVGIGELSYIISQSAGLLSNDTGVSHIASALQVPSVILFSSFSLPQRWAPLNQQLHKIILPAASTDLMAIVQHVLQLAASPPHAIPSSSANSF